MVGALKDHAHVLAQLGHVDVRRIDVAAVEQDRTFGVRARIVSFMRLRQRKNVDLPQPEGPISAVMRFSWIPKLRFFKA